MKRDEQDFSQASGYILFEYFGWHSIVIALVARLFGLHARYLKLAPSLLPSVERLNALSIVGLDYDWIENAQFKFYSSLTEVSEFLLETEVLNSPLFLGFKTTHRIDDEMLFEKLERTLQNQIAHELWSFNELMLFWRYYKCLTPHAKIIIWAPRDFLRRACVRWQKCEILHLFVPGMEIFWTFSQGFLKVCKKFRHLLSKGKPKAAGENEGSYRKVDSLEILYFPHKGIFYDRFFVKDHYYSQDPTSPFHASNILHLSLGEPESILQRSYNYYQKYRIPHADLYGFRTVKKAEILKRFLKILLNERVPGYIALKGLSPIFFFFRAHRSLEVFVSSLDKFPKAKIALIGYEIVFPQWLSFALSIRGIRSVASQERMLGAWLDAQMPALDHYFSFGQAVCEHLKARKRSAISNITPLGLVRLDSLHRLGGLKSDSKYDAIRAKFEKIVLCLDFHSVGDEWQDRRNMTNRWSVNSIFYDAVLRLATEFPTNYFVIKGKNHDFMANPHFERIVAEIQARPNIEVETDYSTYRPEIMINQADLALGFYTSLLDEFLAAGKPAIIFDITGVPSSFYDYDGLPVIARSFESLMTYVAQALKTGSLLTHAQQSHLARHYFENSFDGQVRARFQVFLREVYDDCGCAL